MPSSKAPLAIQATFDDLGTPLRDVTFVVVDLETTGGSATASEITEVGAVKVRGGEVLGEFQTLVNPGLPIPAFISVLTGITDRMVASAPRIDTVLPAFLEFAHDTVLVAHNAPFDVTFLKVNAERLGLPWPGHRVVDTAHLARQLVTRDEAPNRKLSSLAQLFGAATTPDHRALHDARATVDVLHALLGRVGNLGVHTLEELGSFTSRVSPQQRRKRFLADGLPSAPGVYVFKDSQQRPLYVGTSVDIRRRVRSYFTASEQRTRMAEMVGIAETVTPIVCATPLEAEVRELRLIAEHKPRYNRRSRFPEKSVWVKLTVEAFPRLSVVKDVRDDGAQYAGPFGSRAQATEAIAALHEVVPLRQCTARLSTRGQGKACALADIGRCGAPCTGEQSVESYGDVVARATEALAGDARAVVEALEQRMSRLADKERFEDAGHLRDRLMALVRAAARAQRIAPLAASPEVVAARRRDDGGWEVVCVRHGRLAGTTITPRGADPMPAIEALRAGAEIVPPPVAPAPAALPEETEKVLRWLEAPGVRIVHLDGEWTCPMHGAGAARDRLEPLLRSRGEVAGFGEVPGRFETRPAAAVPSAG
ncbi:DEDD exonuclease domain-containing protein [Luteipulveratus halotolerans]|uniref:Endonuclease n=1 Tax=Luteipulveratus halotolerans TaxID=1631356 RepID=A0A0L6CHA8_9MICO|nr:DEDD exonuclease domain-containing protein [Luteipulveratus halotolerans]KNX36950.1 endonuclease [Luteipulveratus halotolerans]